MGDGIGVEVGIGVGVEVGVGADVEVSVVVVKNGPLSFISLFHFVDSCGK